MGKASKGIDNKWPVEEIISNCVTVEELKASSKSCSFFEVQIGGISRHAAASVLNQEIVRKYIGEVCPVSFNNDFPYASFASNMIREDQTCLALNIYIDEEKRQLLDPFE